MRICSIVVLLFLVQLSYGFVVGPSFNYTSDFTSDLPVILLNANIAIPVEDDTIVNMTVIYDGDSEYWTGLAEISLHGGSSRLYPQKSMNLKSLHFDGSNDKFAFFGFPKDKSWLLINHFNDRALMRNALSYDLFSQLGRYAPRHKHVEVFINNVYSGIYLFVEKITQGKNRVAIKEIDDDDDDDFNNTLAVTGGYIWKHDEGEGWVNQYPSKSDITDEQKNYLFNEFIPYAYGSLFGANDTVRKEIIEDESFIDYFLLSELASNVDAFRKSQYFYKDRDDVDPRIHAGPAWDFDWAWKFIGPYQFIWIHTDTDNCCDSYTHFYQMLFNSSESYLNQTIAQWFNYRENVYSEENILTIIDGYYQLLNSSGAASRHFALYNTFGINALENILPNETYLPLAANYEEEIGNLKTFITLRLEFMDSNITSINTTYTGELLSNDFIASSHALSPYLILLLFSLVVAFFL